MGVKVAAVLTEARLGEADQASHSTVVADLSLTARIQLGTHLPSVSVSMRFKTYSASTQQALFCANDGDPAGFGINIGILSGGVYVQSFSNSSNNAFVTPNILTNNTWYDLVVVSNGSQWSIYIDCVLQSLSVLVGGTTGQWYNLLPSLYFSFGTQTNATIPLYFDGQLDFLRLHGIPLPIGEIATLYANQFWWMKPRPKVTYFGVSGGSSVGAGSVTFALNASGVGQALATGNGSASLAFTVSGAAQALATGAGAASFTFAVSGASQALAIGSGAVSFVLSVSGASQALATAAGSLAFDFTTAGSGQALATGSGSLAFEYDTSGVAQALATGSGSWLSSMTRAASRRHRQPGPERLPLPSRQPEPLGRRLPVRQLLLSLSAAADKRWRRQPVPRPTRSTWPVHPARQFWPH